MGGAPTKVEYISDTNSFYWMDTEWMSAIVIVGSLGLGLFNSGMWYLLYVCIKEIIMTFPYDYIDYMNGKVTEASLVWPELERRGSINKANAG